MSDDFEKMLQELKRMDERQLLLERIGSTINLFSDEIEKRRPDRMMEFAQLMHRLMNDLDKVIEFEDEFEKGRLTITVRFQRRRQPTVLSIVLWEEE